MVQYDGQMLKSNELEVNGEYKSAITENGIADRVQI